jgi:hypothetical protein
VGTPLSADMPAPVKKTIFSKSRNRIGGAIIQA